MKISTTASAAGVIGILLVTAGCSAPAPRNGSTNEDVAVDGTFVYGATGDPGTLSPHLAIASAAGMVLPLAYDSLIHFATDGTSSPWLAESWEATTTSVTYTLKSGIECADGTTLTAETAANNFTFIDDAANGSPRRGNGIPNGITTAFDNAANTFTVTAATPSSFLLEQTGSILIACQAVLDDPTAFAATTNGTGLFDLTEAVSNDHYTFERRGSYDWGFDDTTADTAGVPKTITVRVVPSETTLANELLAGSVNAGMVLGADSTRLDAAGLESIATGSLAAGFMSFNQTTTQATTDLDVRKALVSALDLDALANLITSGKGERTTSTLVTAPAACIWDTSGNLPDFDTDAAAALLDEGGWTLGSDGFREKDGEKLNLVLLYNISDAVTAAAEYTQKQWESIGVEVELRGSTITDLISATLTDDLASWDVSFLTVGSQRPSDQVAYYVGPVPPEGVNFTGSKNAEYETLVTTANTLTSTESCDTWQQAEEAKLANLDMVPYATQPEPIYFSGATMSVDASALLGPILRVVN